MLNSFPEGIDFYYQNESQARKLVDFFNTVLPIRYQHSKKLISHDIHSNTYNYKFSYSVEIVPLSKDSLVCLPKNLRQQHGGINPLILVHRVTNTLHFIDPTTAQRKFKHLFILKCFTYGESGIIFWNNFAVAEMNATTFWRYPFNTICNPKQLSEYIVMEMEVILAKDRKTFPGQGTISHKVMVLPAT